MSNFDALPEDEQKFILAEIHGQTLLSDNTIRELLNNGWSYTQDGDGHKWTINALEANQTVALPPGQIAIPEILLPPSGVPINSNAVAQIYQAHRLPEGEKPTVEYIILMAILRAVHKGYQDREVAAAKAKAAENNPVPDAIDVDMAILENQTVDESKPVQVRYYGDQITEYENEAAYQQALKDGDEIANFGEVVTDE